jgi:multidrug efflux system membrane fusion protein
MDTKNRKFPVLLAGGIVIAVSLWMLSGVGNDPTASTISPSATRSAAELQQVRVQALQAHPITREILLSGRTEPNRFVQVRAETEGTVTAIRAERGEIVANGAALLLLDKRDREARLAEATALVEQRELEARAIENLREQRFTTDVQIAEARTLLESARASRERIELEIRNTTITAPFDGVLQERNVEIGDFVRVGDTVADMVDLDPLIIAGEVNEREVTSLETGSAGTAILVDGTELGGTVRYIAPVSDANTRSFLVELAVPNPDNAVRAGLTAELRLQADAIRVHTLSAAMLSLADDGTVGVKIVDNMDSVRFYPVEIAGNTPDGMHVTGLPDTIRLITVGQGFVTEGQQVVPVMVSTPESAAAYERAD